MVSKTRIKKIKIKTLIYFQPNTQNQVMIITLKQPHELDFEQILNMAMPIPYQSGMLIGMNLGSSLIASTFNIYHITFNQKLKLLTIIQHTYIGD